MMQSWISSLAQRLGVSLFVVEVIKDGQGIDCLWITWKESGNVPEGSSPGAFQLPEFIVGHFNLFQVG
ncbi:hypothetical protein K3369_29440 [Pseudomonas mandelii]|uniref:hypothetical protein n=1 Tax=Pseudomonas mandelii TaxID=75612 RepID=UPI001C834192|nr:hypothetical protein [Pseudomonas mandelii]QZA97784.1 hypothetical protein K3369_29440 [Pseudomonas mandelii]